MQKDRKLQPEEAFQLQEEIEAFLRSHDFMQSEGFGDDSAYTQRHVKALRELDPKFFEDMAALCETKSQRWYFLQPDQQGVRWIAVLARIWLKRNQQTVTKASVRKLTQHIWAARLAGYEPGYVEIVETYEIPPDEKFLPEGGTGEIHRYPGLWSELDYITALVLDTEIPEKLREKIEDIKRRSFPKNAWKKVWLDPYFADLKP
jgi:hypothetical protein